MAPQPPPSPQQFGLRPTGQLGPEVSFVALTVTDGGSEVHGLPRLNYNLWDHKTKLCIVSGLLILECSVLPIVLFYGLWYGTTLRHGICASFPAQNPCST